MINVFVHELRWNLRSALIWALSLSLVGLFMLAVFPAFAADMELMMQLLKAFPESVVKALGIVPGTINSFNGFYSFLIVYSILCASTQGLIFGLNAVGTEGARKTCDFLFTKPAPRWSILMQKYCAMLALVALGAMCYALTSYVAARALVSDFDARGFWLFTGSYALTQVFCLSIGFCIGCVRQKVKSPNSVGIGLGALMFALLMVENLSDERSIALISPLSYLNPRYIAAHGAYDMPYLWALIALTVALVGFGTFWYSRRDIHSA